MSQNTESSTPRDTSMAEMLIEAARLGAERALLDLAARGWVPKRWFPKLSEAATYVGLNEVTLCVLLRQGLGPKAYKIGHGWRTGPPECDEWVRQGGAAGARARLKQAPSNE